MLQLSIAQNIPLRFLRNIKRHVKFIAFFCIVGASVGTILISPLTYFGTALKGPEAHFAEFVSLSLFGFCALGLPIAFLTGLFYLLTVCLLKRYSVKLVTQRALLAWLNGFVPWAVPMLPYLRNSEDAYSLLIYPLFFSICSVATICILSWVERRWPVVSFTNATER